MKRLTLIATLVGIAAAPAAAAVFLNEVLVNPPGGADSTAEFIELMGTPGRKLDGYAIAFANGTEAKYYTIGSLTKSPHEIDEFFSLDGLQLGANGLLVIGIGFDFVGDYPTLLDDTEFRNWSDIWNGGLDTPGKLQNDGSNTILLVRNRPGVTEADPANPDGLRWGKEIPQDAELFTPVEDPPGSGQFWDQWGNGNLDKGEPDGEGGFTLDLKGASTPAEVADDLEVVDELSYEHEAGWEYDLDGRHVDEGSTHGGLPYRRVHALDDPQGFNPDGVTRVDYRTKGDGWPAAPGATGELPGGNNWQDTATEQWIRGESVGCYFDCPGAGDPPQFFYDNADNDNPDAIQPYVTNVPLWLADDVPPDYDFSTGFTFQIMAGRVNPLAVPYIPGDADRDGDCDAEDIAKIAAVFGDADWIFSNSYDDAPEGDGGDPALQIRPWDVDATGDNGIEAGDLQWTLNFQGDTTGRVVGVQYDDTAPSTTGVYLNPNAGVACGVTLSVSIPSGHAPDALTVGDPVEVTVLGELTAGAITTAGQENGIMQFAHDLSISVAGVLQVTQVEPAAPFTATREGIQTLLGSGGDLGVALINGHTTSFAQGLGGPAPLYTVTLQALDPGDAAVSVKPTSADGFAAGTPDGLKVGHTDSRGNPAAASYPDAVSFSVTSAGLPGDLDGDGDVDAADQAVFAGCLTGPGGGPVGAECAGADLDLDTDADLQDWAAFQLLFSGP